MSGSNPKKQHSRSYKIALILCVFVLLVSLVFIIYYSVTAATGPCKPTCVNKKCGEDDGCGGKCQGDDCRGPPSQQQINLVRNTVTAFSKLFSDSDTDTGPQPVVMFVNFTDEDVVARLGAGSGIIPCSQGQTPCLWGNNDGKSTIYTMGDPIKKSLFDNGISQTYAILKPNQAWVIKIPLDVHGAISFCSGSSDNNNTKECGTKGQNLYFNYGLTGRYFDINGKPYNTVQEARDASQNEGIPWYQFFPECRSNANKNLSIGNGSQLEMGLYGSTTDTDLSSVDGVSRPLYHAVYDCTNGDPIMCQYRNKNTNHIYCNYDRKNCDFPDYFITDDGTIEIAKDSKGEPYNCIQPGDACAKYRSNPKLSTIWGTPQSLEEKFTFQDSFGTVWNKDGCKPGTTHCVDEGENGITYMGMTLTGGSCELMKAGKFELDNHNWVSGSKPPPNSDKDLVWKKYESVCGSNNFGSTSDRLRMCKFLDKTLPSSCPINSGGSCINNTTDEVDTWASPVMQKFCESCHNDKCMTYCQAYDDYWGTMSCSLTPKKPNVVLITY